MALLFALVLATGGAAGAQDEEEAVQPPAGDGTGYQGAAPGDGPTAGRKPHHGRTPMVTWLGFQPQQGGGARVFVQLDREVPHAQLVHEGTLIVSLTGARAAHHNNRRFLDTRFFDTTVERVSIEPARRRPGQRRSARGLELVIRFKNAAQAREVTADMSRGKDGFTYLIIDLPRLAAGTAAASTTPED